MSEFFNNNFNNAGEPLCYAVTFDRSKAVKTAKRMKFVSIMTIISGALQILASPLTGIFLILAGLKLKSSSERFKSVIDGKGKFESQAVCEDLTDYYRKKGIVYIIEIVGVIFSIFGWGLYAALMSGIALL